MRRRSTGLVSPGVDALRQIDGWGAGFAAAAVVGAGGEVLASHGPRGEVVRWASITKPMVALAVLVAAEEGVLDLDQPAGPEGSTVRHLLAHASGLPFVGRKPIAPVGRRRIYSNTGFILLGDELERAAEMPLAEYLHAAVVAPLGIRAELRGSAAADLFGSLDDLIGLARELQSPTVVAQETLDEMTSVQFAGLAGVLPDVGRFDPNDWGLGVELRDGKQPHWTGTRNSARTFGHFGGSGTFLWIDPEAGIALACLTDRQFGEWALEAWPRLSDDVLAEAAA
jgi:CubicO group peptidase (beta-lactamase class C family)